MIKQLLKKNKLIVFTFFLFCALGAQAQTPVEKYGQLQIKNGKVSDKDGNPVVLRGMSMFWSGYPEGTQYYNSSTVKWLRDDWCVDVVRAAMAVETGNTNYVNNASTEMAKVKAVIDACIDNGMYVIVDFHTHNAPNYMNQAKTFFTEIANEYGDLPNIIYEPYNEPIYQSWSNEIKPYHNEIISTIRAIDDNNIIVCGTKTYSQDVDEAANDPVTGTNVAYTLHYYADSHKGSLRQKAINAMNKGAALFVTEYGTCNATGNTGFNAAESQVWWDFLEEHQISSCNWSVSNKAETASILKPYVNALSNWSDNDLTESGLLVKNYLDQKCNLDITTGSVTLSFTDDRTQFDAGESITISAATTVSSNGAIDKVVFYSGDDVIEEDNSSPYSITVDDLNAGGHDIIAKSYTSNGDLIAESPVYVITVVGASNVSTTGITDQFESDEQFVELTGGVNGESCATASDAAAAGIFWFQDTDPETAFEAIASREGDGTLKYVLSQEEASYNVVGFNFGEYCDDGTKEKYYLDLTQNAVLNLTLTSPASNTVSMDIKFQIKDADGTVLAFNKTVLNTDGEIVDEEYRHEIGYSKNHSAPDYPELDPGTTSNFVFDFKDALTIDNPNNPTFPDDINKDNSDFDYSKVAEVVIIPVNSSDIGPPSYAPEAYTDQELIFSGLTFGDPTLGDNICTTPNPVTTTDVAYCEGETEAEALTADGIDGLTLKWYTEQTGGVGTDVAPIPSTSYPETITYWVSQATSATSTCEGPRTPLDVIIAAKPTVDAGEDQSNVEGPSVILTGTGSDIGTWVLEDGPALEEPLTFTPSINSETVTVDGLTETGTYDFLYIVEGETPCASNQDTVSVEITTITSGNELFLSNHEVEIYPNPVNDNLHIDLGNAEDIQSINLIDVTGRVVYSVENTSSTNINMSEFSKGMYFVQIQSGSGTLVKSIVK